jgi:hypothetical protein
LIISFQSIEVKKQKLQEQLATGVQQNTCRALSPAAAGRCSFVTRVKTPRHLARRPAASSAFQSD